MKLITEYKMKVPGSERLDTIVRNNLFARNPKIYPVPPDKPDEIPRMFPGNTERV